jgi:3-oxocholest-4-en-26-oyl-CoA dehydrogenase beta subunit
MDFILSAEHRAIRELAGDVFTSFSTAERRRQLAAQDRDFDDELWLECARTGLLTLTLAEDSGGAGLGLVDACALVIEAGRHTAPIPAAPHLAAATTLARYGTDAQCRQAAGEPSRSVLTVAVAETHGVIPERPLTTATRCAGGYRLTGVKTLVPAGQQAAMFLVTAQTETGTAVFVVTPADDGVSLIEQRMAGGYRLAELRLSDTEVSADRLVGPPDGAAAAFLADLSVLTVCAQQFGVTSEAVAKTAEYAKARRQFGRPIGSFQAVAHRLADGYIDILGQELTLWKAAWLLDAGLPAKAAVSTAKFWAAEAGHRVAHSAIHIHGGVGVDLTGDIHRYYSMAAYLEFAYGAAHHHAQQVGRLMGRPGFFT